jgi:hypothetical protein
VDLIDGAHGLQQDHLRLAGRRSVVVDGRGRRLVEEHGRAPGRAPRIGEVTDLEAWDVGDRPRRKGRLGTLARMSGPRGRCYSTPEGRSKLTPPHVHFASVEGHRYR